MKLEKYKYLKNGKYEVIIDKVNYIIYEDIIIKNNLLLKKEIDNKELETLLEDNSFYEAYYKSLKYIEKKLRTREEIRKYLNKNSYNEDIINKVIIKLENEKYLDDNIYAKAYIHDQIALKLVGPRKIKSDLLQLKIKEEIIDDNLHVYNEEIEKEKLTKLISKEIKLNKTKSSYILKNKILNNMIGKGFSKEYVIEVLNEFDIDDKNIYKMEYEKLYKKLSKKYNGNELDYKIKQKLYQKGFR